MHRRNMEVLSAQHERNIAVLKARHRSNMAALLHRPLHEAEHLIHPPSTGPFSVPVSAEAADSAAANRALSGSSSWSRGGLTFVKEGDGINILVGNPTGVLGGSYKDEGEGRSEIESESEGELGGYYSDGGVERQGLEPETAALVRVDLEIAIEVEDTTLQLTSVEGGHTLPVGEEAIPSATATAHGRVLSMGDSKLDSPGASNSPIADRVLSTQGLVENRVSNGSGSFEAAPEQVLIVGAKCTAQVGQLADLRSAAVDPSSCLFEFTLNTRSGEVSCRMCPQQLYHANFSRDQLKTFKLPTLCVAREIMFRAVILKVRIVSRD